MGEGCVTVTWIQFNLQLLQITGDPTYAEELERSVYNHLFAAENPETGCVSYYTALQGAKPYKCDQGYSCCLSSGPRGISLIPAMIWGKIDQVFSVLLYESGEATDSIQTKDRGLIGLRIQCSSSLPETGKLIYTIHPSSTSNFSLNFRIPEWSASFRARIGNEVYTPKNSGLLQVTRNWKEGDQVEVNFDIPVRLIAGGLSYPDRIAIKRGPQVLAVDLGLNPEIDSFSGLKYQGNGGFGDASDRLPTSWDWKQAYFANFRAKDKSLQVVLVPFAEAGQQGGQLEVWLQH
jgi:hypothetical protein